MLSSKEFFQKYNMNMTEYLTLPAFSLAVYGAKYYNEEHNIKVIKGLPEKHIRQAYFGGNVGVYVPDNLKGQILNDLFVYDMNSQYPNAMLNDMPVGNPVFTNSTDLNSFFGFCYGTIIPPKNASLTQLYIQCRHEDGSISNPKTPFKR